MKERFERDARTQPVDHMPPKPVVVMDLRLKLEKSATSVTYGEAENQAFQNKCLTLVEKAVVSPALRASAMHRRQSHRAWDVGVLPHRPVDYIVAIRAAMKAIEQFEPAPKKSKRSLVQRAADTKIF